MKFISKLISVFVLILLIGFFAIYPTKAESLLPWHPVHPLEFSRLGMAAIPYNGKVYLVGGTSNGSDAYGDVLIYDPVNDNYQSKTSMPTAGFLFGAAEVNGKIYTIGGNRPNWSFPSYVVEVYDIVNDTWSTKSSVPSESGVIMDAVALNGKIYTLVGNGDTLSEYDPATDTWRVATSVPTTRNLGRMAVANNEIYVIGGVGSGGLVESYNPITNSWTTRASMPTDRYGLGTAVTSGGVIYAIGGVNANNEASNVVEAYDPVADSWTSATSLSLGRYFPGVTAVENDLFVFGGYGTPPTNGPQSLVETTSVAIPTPTPTEIPVPTAVPTNTPTPTAIPSPTVTPTPSIRMPGSKDACKNGGWQYLTDDQGNPFSNQGQCISFYNHHH